MVEKVRPRCETGWTEGNDGRDAHSTFEFYCPTCGRHIFTTQTCWLDLRMVYSLPTACDECGTFFDWSKSPRIKTTSWVEWE